MARSSTKYFLEVDSQKRSFRFSSPVFSGKEALPILVSRYFAQMSSLVIENEKVVLCEELPFSWGSQPTLRQQFYRMIRRANMCRHLLKGIAHIEQKNDIDSILDS